LESPKWFPKYKEGVGLDTSRFPDAPCTCVRVTPPLIKGVEDL